MPKRRMASLISGALILAACGSSNDTSSSAAPPSAEASAPGDQTTPTDADTPTEDPGAGAPSDTEGRTAGEPFSVEQIESSPVEVTTSGLQVWRDRSAPDTIAAPLVDYDELRSGGPPPDGIPPIDTPKFLNAGDVDFLADSEPVLALEIDGDARAYPVQVMTWHEIVNDTVGGIPVSVTYCPLCNSALAYDRRVGDQVLDFGTSGLLYNSSLVMYDRQTETLWSHFTGQGIIGELTGQQLTDFPLSTVSWGDWKQANPDGLVLSRDTGFSRDYGRNPYPGYDDVNGIPFLFEGDVDGQFTAMTRIVGVEQDGQAVGVPLVELEGQRVITGTLGDTALVFWWTDGLASALDTASIDAGANVGATGVFIPEADGTALTFQPGDKKTFVDDQTGSTWNVLGEAIDGELTGAQLTPVSHVDTFWFAWSTFQPDTTIITG